ncbi:MAG: histidine kinase, partial [Propionibacteriaceae bacterium]|nr:histidine kinase [Propionibacteriaceae bacterium]
DSVSFWATMLVELMAVLLGLLLRAFLSSRVKAQVAIARLQEENAEIRLTERRQLARELHDVVAHHLSLISLQVMGHRDAPNPAELRAAMDRIEASSRSALEELRALVGVLNAPSAADSTDDLTCPRKIVEAVDHFASVLADHDRPLAVTMAEGLDDLGLAHQKTLSRIVQESVTNILKYAPAGHPCELTISRSVGEVRLRIVNDLGSRGDGDSREPDDASLTSGWGLRSLRERVDLLGGSFGAGPQGSRWAVEAMLPTPA